MAKVLISLCQVDRDGFPVFDIGLVYGYVRVRGNDVLESHGNWKIVLELGTGEAKCLFRSVDILVWMQIQRCDVHICSAKNHVRLYTLFVNFPNLTVSLVLQLCSSGQ